MISNFFGFTEKIKNKRSRRLTKSAKLTLTENLKEYRDKFRKAIEEENQIPNMEIADLQFWYDYVQNHKRVMKHKKLKKELRKQKKTSMK